MNNNDREICFVCKDLDECVKKKSADKPTESHDYFKSNTKQHIPLDDEIQVCKEGICSTCKKRTNCKKRLLVGVIWRCVDYQ